MTNHYRAEYVAPDDQRCQALVKGQPSYVFAWMKVDHQCPKTANQMRGHIAVCHLHARAKNVTMWSPTGRLNPRQPPEMQSLPAKDHVA